MKTNTHEKCVLCNSQSFNIFEKYSQALQYTVKYLQCQSCGLTTVPESGKFALFKIYDEEYFLNTDYGWKGRAELVLNYIW
ncbi:MAG TPA: hypothetical protein VMW28_06695, partial [Pelolinea sp.]|nr:hypothetical protein [Pelolinea sp.]